MTQSTRCQVQSCQRKQKGKLWPLCSQHKFLWTEYLSALTPDTFASFLTPGPDKEPALLNTWCKTQGSLNR